MRGSGVKQEVPQREFWVALRDAEDALAEAADLLREAGDVALSESAAFHLKGWSLPVGAARDFCRRMKGQIASQYGVGDPQ